jgi:hypothetical protein
MVEHGEGMVRSSLHGERCDYNGEKAGNLHVHDVSP